MELEYIIVQAGGKGTRLLPLTKNKPKALVSADNLPIIFHLFHKYPNKKFIVIGDYKFGVLQKYLEVYADVSYLMVHANGEGNSAGIRQALSYVPESHPFMIIWSDLLLPEEFEIDLLETGCYVGVTDRFKCSWRFSGNRFEKTATDYNGLAGCFLFDKKERLVDIPEEGSFAKYLQTLDCPFLPLNMGKTKELGTLESICQVNNKENRCRPYNRITFDGERVIKEGLTCEGRKLIQREVNWYTEVQRLGFKGIPRLYSDFPLTMERIHGENIFKVILDDTEKKEVINQIYTRLNELHGLKKCTVSSYDLEKEYYRKTMERLRSIRTVIPFSNEKKIMINDRECQNIYYYPELLEKKVGKIVNDGQFGIIHGDCTLTNTLIDSEHNVYYIDARGYFGYTDLVGDIYYDWAKVYYSMEGSFDQFNIGNFTLDIGERDVNYCIAPSGWEHMTQYFLDKIPFCDMYRIKLIHAVIWLSLASHCWEDYDSLCTAFYKGLYLLNSFDEG